MVLLLAPRGGAQDVELEVEEFFKLQPARSLGQCSGAWRFVDGAEGGVEVLQVVAPDEVVGQRFLDGHLSEQCKGPLHEFAHSARCEAMLLHALRRVVVREHGERRIAGRWGVFDFGVRNVEPAVERRGFAQQRVGVVVDQALVHDLDAVEPHQLHHPRTVGEECHQAFAAAAALHVFRHNLSFQQNVGHALGEVSNAVYHAPVYIFIGEMVQQVAQGEDFQVLTQHLAPYGAHSFQILDVGLQSLHGSGFRCATCVLARVSERNFRISGNLRSCRSPGCSPSGVPLRQRQRGSSPVFSRWQRQSGAWRRDRFP